MKSPEKRADTDCCVCTFYRTVISAGQTIGSHSDSHSVHVCVCVCVGGWFCTGASVCDDARIGDKNDKAKIHINKHFIRLDENEEPLSWNYNHYCRLACSARHHLCQNLLLRDDAGPAWPDSMSPMSDAHLKGCTLLLSYFTFLYVFVSFNYFLDFNLKE